MHGDLKSNNILVDKSGRVTIADFGMVHCIDTETGEVTDSRKDLSEGSPDVMAPEVMQSQRYSASVDVFAFGLLLWELVARQVPYPAMDQFQILNFVLGGNRPDLDQVREACSDLKDVGAQDQIGKAVVDLIDKCWAHDETTRPRFDEVVESLTDICSMVATATTAE
eukprot:GFYU01002226.1.p1 GENE.GFYU01002226.1~~GFYU01002226.1.p1  ORF type:complete len:167 (-),score=48.88 GFYU01002226.1:152-652(-)